MEKQENILLIQIRVILEEINIKQETNMKLKTNMKA